MKRTLLAVVMALAAGTSSAHDAAQHAAADGAADHSQHNAQAAPAPQKEVEVTLPSSRREPPDARSYFTDLELKDQNGRTVRFYSDVLANRTVMINVMYTSCPDACPLITQAIGAVREQLGAEFGKSVFFISISNDPVTDTPQELKKFAVKNHADVPGWTFLTGSKENVEHILKKLGQFAEEKEAHSTLLIAGNVPAKRWSKMRPASPPTALAERLRALASSAPQAAR